MTNEVIKVLDELFTIGFTINRELSIESPTARLSKLFPRVDGGNFLELFRCQRPSTVFSYDDLTASSDSLFLIIAADNQLALKGQLIDLKDEGRYRFVGMPWLSWMNENAPDVEMVLGDFPKLDAQMDQQFYISGQSNMVRDLEELNKKLVSAELEAKEANRIQSEFFAVMSHEMRTPLNGVISALTLLDGNHDEREQARLVSIARESASSLLSVINYALDFSKIDAGKMGLEPETFDPEEVLNTVVSITSSRAQEKSIGLGSSFTGTPRHRMLGDREKITQILVNLTGNAIKYTDKGRVDVNVVIAEFGDEDAEMRITVSDTGIGIAEDDLPHVFEPFWGRQKGKRKESTGLGLSIVKRLIRLMDGQISIDSVEDVGTTVSVNIPLQIATSNEEPVVSVDDDGGAVVSTALRGRVLLVDDNQTNLMLGQMILEKFGVEVRTASNGLEAVSIANAVTFELILMDISMPEMDGVEATSLINQMDTPPPVVALTAYVGADKVKHFLSSGFKGYLQKPMEEHALLVELNRWLEPSDGQEAEVTGDHEVQSQHTLDLLVKQIGRESFDRVRELFLDESEKLMHELLSAWVRRDLESLRRTAHTLGSSVASFGCEDLCDRFRIIEKAAGASDINAIIEEMKNIDRMFQQSIGLVSAYDSATA